MNLEELLPSAKRMKHQLSSTSPKSIVLRSGRLTLTPKLLHSDEELGRVVFGSGGVKLEAIQTLHILSGQPHKPLVTSTKPHNAYYQLDPVFDGRCEVMLLRNGDVISAPNASGNLLCTWEASEVQVNSSAADLASDEHPTGKNDVDTLLEDETEDEAPDDTVTEVPVTQSVTQPTRTQPSATPRLHEQRSIVVQETPTTDRILGTAEYGTVHENENRLIEPTLPQHVVTTVGETFSTARTGQSPRSVAQGSLSSEAPMDRKRPQSPQVRVNGRSSRKRASPPNPSASVPPMEDRSPKRAKVTMPRKEMVDEEMQPSPLDDINADPSRKTYSVKGKKRRPDGAETTPSKSARSSQRSATATTVVAYEGEPPRVATSNSAIDNGSSAVKFLRKHGGALVSSVEDKCNVLCVRDVGLSKTMKFIQAIARGIPIVTDKWLFESAKAEAFLDLSSFKPSVAQQEKDWGFSLEKVWGTAQTPFQDYSIYFTPALKKTYANFREMDRACQTVGAKVAPKPVGNIGKTIVLAKEEDDPDADTMIEGGETCYHKDLFTLSILRGTLDLDSDEFKIKVKPIGGPRRKGPRKST